MSVNEYPAKLTDGYYYVRTDWEDKNSQLGLYRTLKSAIAKADANPGSFIFTEDGVLIYPVDDLETGEPEKVITTEEEELPSEIVFPNNGNTETILYGKATTLVNVRKGNRLDADKLTTIHKGTLVEILEECDNGWYRIKCDANEFGYICGEFLKVDSSLYQLQLTH
ncbi:MAG: SH3 domain-containing protein [Oscillospiraceae bacterium]|nr:SH3 domain-containing protein [Oscillospiraceae bacterium]